MRQPPALEDDTEFHFVCFVSSANTGNLIELDGRRPRPIDHGPIGELGLFRKAAEVIKTEMSKTDSIQFNVIVLGPTPPPED